MVLASSSVIGGFLGGRSESPLHCSQPRGSAASLLPHQEEQLWSFFLLVLSLSKLKTPQLHLQRGRQLGRRVKTVIMSDRQAVSE
ncbi:unnamed protein product [Linum tenue]|uniref:Uncharacterized protein n=1 Tax=Linum tenue TaxID=586396 RepID=A0AAV0RIL9_9ROSI|nr:unnamed protein product [Linum tenue]